MLRLHLLACNAVLAIATTRFGSPAACAGPPPSVVAAAEFIVQLDNASVERDVDLQRSPQAHVRR